MLDKNKESQSKEKEKEKDTIEGIKGLKRYRIEHPPNLLPLKKSLTFGYPGVYPSTSCQIEEEINQDKLKNGFFDKYVVKSENISGLQFLKGIYADRRKLNPLGNFLVDLLKEKQTQDYYQQPLKSAKVEKVSMNEEGRLKWMNDFTSNEINYKELKLQVPTGLRMDHIIELLAENNSPISKCIWIIKLYLLSEQNSKELSISAIRVEWTNLFTKILEKNILELTKNPSIENNERNGILKWNYCAQVSKVLYDQDLLEQKVFLKWVVESINHSLIKCALLIPIILSLLSEFSRSRVLFVMAIRSIAYQHEKVLNNKSSPVYQTIFKDYCRSIIEFAMLNFSDIFISPEMMHTSKINWDRLISSPRYPFQPTIYKSLEFKFDFDKLKEVYQSLQERSSKFYKKSIDNDNDNVNLSGFEQEPEKDDILWELIPLKLSTNFSSLTSKIFGSLQINDYKNIYNQVYSFLSCIIKYMSSDSDVKYLASTILKMLAYPYIEEKENDINRSLNQSRENFCHDMVESALEDFLDNYDVCNTNTLDQVNSSIPVSKKDFNSSAKHKVNIDLDQTKLDYVVNLYSQFIRLGTFTYSKYLRKLISCGIFDGNYLDQKEYTKHLYYFQNFAIYNLSKSNDNDLRTRVLSQNYPQFENDAETLKITNIIKELKKTLPQIHFRYDGFNFRKISSKLNFSDDVLPNTFWDKNLLCEIRNSSKFIKGQVTSYLIKGVMNYYSSIAIDNDPEKSPSKSELASMTIEELVLIYEILEVCDEIGALIEFSIWLLARTVTRPLIAFILTILKYYQSTLISLGLTETVLSVLWTKYKEIKDFYGQPDKRLALYILNLVTLNVTGSTNSMRAEIEIYIHSLVPCKNLNDISVNFDMPDYVPELYDISPNISILNQQALFLYSKYKNINGWWERLFQVSLKSIETKFIASESKLPNQNLLLIRNYSDLFFFLSDFTLEGTPVVMKWFRNLVSNDFRAFSSHSTIYQWYLVYLCFLVQRSVLSISHVFASIINLFVEQGEKLKVSSPQKLGFNEHFIFLMRLLLTSNYEDNLFDGVIFETQDIFRIKMLQGLSFNSIENMEYVFKILYYICSLEALLTPGSNLQIGFHNLRQDISTSIWMKSFAKTKFHLLYKKFMVDKGKPLLESINLKIPLTFEQERASNAKLIETFLTILGLKDLETKGLDYLSDFFKKDKLEGHDESNKQKNILLQRNNMIISLYLNNFVSHSTTENNSSESNQILKFSKVLFNEWAMDLEIPLSIILQTLKSIPSEFWSTFLSVGGGVLCGDKSSENNKFPNYIKRWNELLEGNPKKKLHEQIEIKNRYKEIIIYLVKMKMSSSSEVQTRRTWFKSKVEFGLYLIHQLKPLVKNSRYFEIMNATECSYEEASKIELKDNLLIDSLALNNINRTNLDYVTTKGLIKDSITIRIEILTPMLRELVEFVSPNMRMDWTEIFLSLLQTPILLGEENKEEFELVLDFFFYFMNLIPKEHKSDLFSTLRKLYPKLNKTAESDARITRLFPFEAKSNFAEEIKNGLNPKDQRHNKEFIPWEWDSNFVDKDENGIVAKFDLHELNRPTLLSPGPQIDDDSPLLNVNNLKLPQPNLTLPRAISTNLSSRPRIAASPITSIRAKQSPLASLQSTLTHLSFGDVPSSSNNTKLNNLQKNKK